MDSCSKLSGHEYSYTHYHLTIYIYIHLYGKISIFLGEQTVLHGTIAYKTNNNCQINIPRTFHECDIGANRDIHEIKERNWNGYEGSLRGVVSVKHMVVTIKLVDLAFGLAGLWLWLNWSHVVTPHASTNHSRKSEKSKSWGGYI